MKHFINQTNTIVTEAIDGVLLSSGGRLARLDGYPSIKVVLRQDWDKSKVAIISGGGSGHEPAHAGFVGEGMLTAAVCGEIFASPSVEAVLAGILAVTGEAGCLLIVKNYTGDRLNFGLAAEKARALGRKVETVIVGDDIAIPSALQRRGIAGTLFVHKVAGHVSERGGDLAAVKNAAESVAYSVKSLGLSLSSCTIPGHPPEERLGHEEAELGLGIHGEPGVEKIQMQTIDTLVEMMMKRLESSLSDTNSKLAVLVNNLGGVPPIEMGVVVNALYQSSLKDRISLLFGPAPLMTSLDMKGFSLSLLPLPDTLREALLSPVTPSAWAAGRAVSSFVCVPPKVSATLYPPSEHPARRRAIEEVCRALVSMRSELNMLDAKLGDGDAGSTFATAAESVLQSLDALPLADEGALCKALSEKLSLTMGGSSGVLLSIFFASVGTALDNHAHWPAALQSGVERIQHYGGAKEGDRTMVDALLPAVRSLEKGAPLSLAAEAAEQGAALTATMPKAGAGRASYLGSNLLGVADPGAAAVAAAFRALSLCL